MSALKNKLSQKLDVLESTTAMNGLDSNNEEIVSEPSENLIVLRPEKSYQNISVIPDFVVSMEEAKNRIMMLQSFVKEMMIPNVDYGLIPKCDKPTLFKSGAEKLTDIFGFSKQFEVINRIEDWDKVLFHYEIKAVLINKRTGLIEAEGLGCCNNRERKYKSQDGYSVINTILKMAKKRALIDAVLSATRSSGIFTQDIEDNEINNGDYASNSSTISPTFNNKDYTNRPTNTIKISTVQPINKVQHTKLLSIINQRKLPINEVRAIMNQRYKVNESKYLSSEQADDFIEFLKLYNVI